MNTIFSVIIPIYNSENYIEKCLNSVLFQDMNNYEILCVNDGSTDRSLQILNKYAQNDSRIKIINTQNKGTSHARNEGIKQSKGDYLLFLDSDDYFYYSSAFSNLYKIIQQSSQEVECIYFPGGCETPTWSGQEKYQSQKFQTGWECLLEHCNKKKILVFGSVYVQCYKKSVLIDNNIFFEENLLYAEDRLFVIKYFFYCKYTVVFPDPIYCYVVHENSVMTTKNPERRIIDNLLFSELAYSFIFQHNLKDKAIKKYINGFYISAVAEKYKYSKKININKKILFNTSVNFKKLFQSILITIHPTLYIKYKYIANFILEKINIFKR